MSKSEPLSSPISRPAVRPTGSGRDARTFDSEEVLPLPETANKRYGLWLIGACGGVGTTTALGLAALRRGLTSTAGLVSALPPFDHVDLCDPANIVVGGHELRKASMLETATHLHQRSGIFDRDLLETLGGDLREDAKNVRPGTLLGASNPVRKMADRNIPADATAGDAVNRLAKDIRAFQRRKKLARVVVVHVASSEPLTPRARQLRTAAQLRRALGAKKISPALPGSAIAALAAIEAGAAYVNFTPSIGIEVPAIAKFAEESGVPYAGRDGKTGETLVKSALAPMFAMRNLPILGWFGQNILGNRDGEVLADLETRRAKLGSKDRVVRELCGDTAHSHVGIDSLPSLDDWKIAWDFIHFEGFLGTKMSMQFSWQGCDSILAAPLVIDLARFALLALDRGESGPMNHLAAFFKNPIGDVSLNLHEQWNLLIDYAAAARPTK